MVGAIGNTKKWCVDTTLPSSSVDLSGYYPDTIELDLRRRFYYEKVRKLMADSGAGRVAMFSDIPALDLYPLWDEFGGRRVADPNVFLGMKINPISLDEDVRAVVGITGATVSRSLRELYGASL
ncbi:hypothetical protein HZC20_00645 [Candidatus Peregrinibacteria bacterium]|nr:hypothetical protein [Candidatus Peregrinibacteria bacterium]